MGIPGLWAELAPAAQTTTLPSYCLTTFTDNHNELRGLRLGIDASLWQIHAEQCSGGANPYLRLLFYRLAKLLSLPVLPLFVFDGPSRPKWKRGKQVKGRQHAIEEPFAQLIEAFGFQWHRAPGEAEAELAHLNQAGFVDAVLTDDADALLFGAQVLIRNWGKNLSGTKALSRTTSTSSDVFDGASSSIQDPAAASALRLQLSGSDRDHLITLYKARDLSNLSDLGIDRDGLVLIALMSGGDYDATGLLQCGVKIALALARCGFGTTLIDAFKASYPDQASASRSCSNFERFLKTWLEEVRNELRTNERGFLSSRRPKLASSIEESFLSTQESRKVLAYYVYPLTSQGKEQSGAHLTVGKIAEPDLTQVARLCQTYFQWSKIAILSKIRTILGPGIVVRRLRQEVLEHNDGAGEGPWAALVESPASKAVRRHMLGLDAEGSASSSASTHRARGSASQASTSVAVPGTQKEQPPLYRNPNATRITDFFARPATSAGSTTVNTGREASNNRPPHPPTSLSILAIKLQRRHAALDPFLDYRVLVSMEEFSKAAELGIDPEIDAELAAKRAATMDDTSETDVPADEDEEPSKKKGGTNKPSPESPLLMWIPEPLLQMSVSGAAPLEAFLKELERKAAAARAKEAKKAAPSVKAIQTTLTSFVRPLSKPSLAGRMDRTTAKATAPSADAPSPTPAEAAPRTPRQLVVPSGMRGMRRTESVPVSKTTAPSIAPHRPFTRQISLPAPIEASPDFEVDGDSSIEFLGSLVSNRPSHQRPPTPLSNPSSSDGGQRPHKSPKKARSTAFAQRSFAHLTSHDDDDEEEGPTTFGAAQAKSVRRPAKPRVSTITISDSSADEGA